MKSSNPENLETALIERLEACKKMKAIAESEGNSHKARRYGRICKQFEDAIKLYVRGKPIPLDELPTPPGFEPLTTVITQSVPDPTIEKNDKPLESKLPTSSESESFENKLSSDPKAPISPPRAQTGIFSILYINLL